MRVGRPAPARFGHFRSDPNLIVDMPDLVASRPHDQDHQDACYVGPRSRNDHLSENSRRAAQALRSYTPQAPPQEVPPVAGRASGRTEDKIRGMIELRRPGSSTRSAASSSCRWRRSARWRSPDCEVAPSLSLPAAIGAASLTRAASPSVPPGGAAPRRRRAVGRRRSSGSGASIAMQRGTRYIARAEPSAGYPAPVTQRGARAHGQYPAE